MRTCLKIVSCGAIAGVVLFLSVGLSVSLFASQAIGYLHDAAPFPKRGGGWFMAMDLMMGVWFMWNYSMIRPRYRTMWAAAIATGLSWWVIKSLQSAHWIGLGFASISVVPSLAFCSLLSVMTASFAGAYLFDRTIVSAATESSVST